MPTYAAGDMAAGTATPDFQRTINVYDSQGGSQPLTFSFIKTGANTWAYEVSYAGQRRQSSPAPIPIATGTMTFNSDGTLANVNGAAPAIRQRSASPFPGPRPPASRRRPSPSTWARWTAPTA